MNSVIVFLEMQDRRQLHCSKHCKPALPQEHDLNFAGKFLSGEKALNFKFLVHCIARLLGCTVYPNCHLLKLVPDWWFYTHPAAYLIFSCVVPDFPQRVVPLKIYCWMKLLTFVAKLLAVTVTAESQCQIIVAA